MKAIRIHEDGGPEVLRYEDVPDPEPADGEVLIELRAASLNTTSSGAIRLLSRASSAPTAQA